MVPALGRLSKESRYRRFSAHYRLAKTAKRTDPTYTTSTTLSNR